MSQYLGNCNIVDWNAFVADLEKQTVPAFVEARLIGSGFGSDEYPTYPGEVEDDLFLLNRFKDANYNFESAVWHLYRPEEHYDKLIADRIASHFKIQLGWISIFKLDPGCTAPMHFEDGVPIASASSTSRIWIQLSLPEHGQVLMVGNDVFYNTQLGDAYRWDHYTQEHSAANCSMKPWYFAFLQGIRTDL
jgi:hypothetical protein